MVIKMKVDELKMYLTLRGLKVTGIKAELIARVFVASEACQKSAAEIESDLQSFYMGNSSSRPSLFNFWLAWRG